MAPPRIPLQDRFLQHTDRSGGEDACWVWTGCKRAGYGSITINGKGVGAHRVSYEFYYGPIPEGMLVCHSCDNRPCINPKHLFLGTPVDNMRDRDEKGRNARGRCAPHHVRRGEENHMTKLTSDQVIEIRTLQARGMSYRRIAGMFGITKTCVCDLVHRRTWTHISQTDAISMVHIPIYEPLMIIAPDGTEQLVQDVEAFCNEHHLNASTLRRVAKGFDKATYTQHKGFKARFPAPS